MDYQRLCQYHRNIKATEYLFQRIIHDFDEWECLKKTKKQKKATFLCSVTTHYEPRMIANTPPLARRMDSPKI